MTAVPNANQEPVIFCAAYPCETTEFSGAIRMPMGAPPLQLDAARCCEGIQQTLGSFSLYLSVLYPFLKMLACVTSVIAVLTAIMDFLKGFTSFPPPSITDVTDAVAKAAYDCAYLTQVIPPLAILSWLLFIYDVISYVLALLRCIRSMLWITIDNDTEYWALKGSPDPFMRDQAECLNAQNNQLKDALMFKISAIRILLDMITIISALLPGIPGVTVNLSTQGGHIDIVQLDAAISALTSFKAVLGQAVILAGGTAE
jgi:hypothetical protein